MLTSIYYTQEEEEEEEAPQEMVWLSASAEQIISLEQTNACYKCTP